MIYTYTRTTPIEVFGEVDIKVFDKEDLVQMEPKVSILTENDTAPYLLEELNKLMFGNTSSQSSIQLTTDTGWFTDRYAGTSGETYTTQDGKNGIVAHTNRTTGYVTGDLGGGTETEAINHFYLFQGLSTPNPGSTDKHVTWTAQSEWDKELTATVNGLDIGKDYNAGLIQPSTTFDQEEFASVEGLSPFDIEKDDILKVTWTMTIG